MAWGQSNLGDGDAASERPCESGQVCWLLELSPGVDGGPVLAGGSVVDISRPRESSEVLEGWGKCSRTGRRRPLELSFQRWRARGQRGHHQRHGGGGDAGAQTFNRDPPVAWGEYKMSEDAASLRKLWAMSREVCKSEIESLASGDSSVSKQKVGVANSLAMEKDAVDSGMPRPGSDAERPSLYTLTRVSRSLVPPGATYEHIPWEAYIDAEEEGRLSRLGKMPKAQPELVIKDSKLALNSKAEEDLPPAGIVDGEKGLLP